MDTIYTGISIFVLAYFMKKCLNATRMTIKKNDKNDVEYSLDRVRLVTFEVGTSVLNFQDQNGGAHGIYCRGEGLEWKCHIPSDSCNQ